MSLGTLPGSFAGHFYLRLIVLNLNRATGAPVRRLGQRSLSEVATENAKNQASPYSGDGQDGH